MGQRPNNSVLQRNIVNIVKKYHGFVRRREFLIRSATISFHL